MGQCATIPITAQTVHFDKGRTKCYRTQLPLALAWAVTIHKSQGMTVGFGEVWERLTLSLGDTELSAGLTFVALSRIKQLVCLMFKRSRFPTKHRLSLCKSDTLKLRQNEDNRLLDLSRATQHRLCAIITRGVQFSADEVY